MHLHDALYTTRAMRRLRPDPIPLDVQARILDAAIRAPHVAEQWRFLLIDDRDLMAELAALYRTGSDRFLARMGMTREQMTALPGTLGKAGRSATYLVDHFAEVPLLLIGFDRSSDGCGIYPALWSAMLAARAEGIGSTMTTMLSSEMGPEVRALLGVPEDEGWVMHGAVPMGYPRGPWGIAKRQPVETVVRRNGWSSDSGFVAPDPLWTPQLD
ncbi:MAG: nitroreductase family protein [Thermomicrobiales bacterium]